MTPEEVQARVEQIRAMAGDDEAAHSAEDELQRDVLTAIARGCATNPEECARITLSTAQIDFARWCT